MKSAKQCTMHKKCRLPSLFKWALHITVQQKVQYILVDIESGQGCSCPKASSLVVPSYFLLCLFISCSDQSSHSPILPSLFSGLAIFTLHYFLFLSHCNATRVHLFCHPTFFSVYSFHAPKLVCPYFHLFILCLF